MECPHCRNELTLYNAPRHNVDVYGNPVLAIALCCGKGVRLVPIRSIRVEAYDGERAEDDWGNPLKK